MDSLSQRAKTDRGRTPTRERHAAAAPGPRRRVTSLVAGGQELKSRSQFRTPLEPIISKLANGYVDGSDLSLQLRRLFSVRPRPRRRPRRRGRGSPGDSDGSGRAARADDCAGYPAGQTQGPWP